MPEPGSNRHRLTITVRESGGVRILDLAGPLNAGESLQAFREHINELLDSGTKNFAVNPAKVNYVDSSGIGTLVGTHTSIEAAGEVQVLCGSTERNANSKDRSIR